MTVPTISNLPTVPATSDPNFETEAPALFNHIKNTFVSEMNSAISFINSSTFDATVEFKNANFTAARNFLYMIDTSSAGVSVTLPANPSTGDQLLLMDQKRSFGTNNLTIGRNSQNINGAASDVVSKSTGALIRCVFQASYGWTVDLYEGEWESGTSAGDLVYNGGNVGIGTSDPYSSLTVRGTGNSINLDLNSTTTGSNSSIVWNGSTSDSNPNYSVAITGYREGSGAAGALGLKTRNGTSGNLEERMLIDSSGNVGIGETSPSSKLDIGLTSSFNQISGKYIDYRQVGDGTNEGYLLLIPAHTTGTTGAKRFNGTIVADRGSTINGNESMRARINVFAAYTNNQGMLELFGNADHYFSKLVIVTFSGVDYIAAYFEQTGGGPANGIFIEDAIVAGLDSNCLTIKYGSEINAVVDSNFGSITSNILGKVGIGTSAPSGDLHIESDNLSTTQIIMKSTAAGGKEYHLNCTANSSSIGGGKFAIRDFTANAYRMIIDSNVEVTTGNLVIGTAGKGIDFSASSHFGGTGGGTGMSSELLDDYEEGTFTPAFIDTNGDATFTHDLQKGRYTKVGDCVYFSLTIGTDSVTAGTGDLKISGLPFTAQNSESQIKPSGAVGINYSWGTSPTHWLVNANSDAVILYKSVNPLTASKSADCGTTVDDNRLFMHGFYFV